VPQTVVASGYTVQTVPSKTWTPQVSPFREAA